MHTNRPLTPALKVIKTQQSRLPWLSVAIVLIPWMALEYNMQMSNAAITFTIKKFVDNPALIGFISSSNQAFGLLIGSVVSLISDRIWTRLGRRRPFLLTAFFSAAALSLIIPNVEVMWGMVAAIVIYQLMWDFSAPWEPLTMEAIPSPQRGRAGVIRQWYTNAVLIIFFFLLIGRFDDTYQLPFGLSITGEQLIYTINSLILLGCGFLILFFIKEEKPEDAEAYRFRDIPILRMLRDLFRRDLLPLFGLAFVMMNLWIGLAQFEPLLVTEQWGYSKQDFGNMMSLGVLLTVLAVPIGGWASDKIDRLLLLKLFLGLVLALKLSFYIYAEYLTPDGVPPLQAVIAIGVIRQAVQSLSVVAVIPLIFDYVSTNRLGALSCAMGIVFSFVAFVQVNAMGVWINFSSKWIFGLPDGEYNYMAAYHFIFFSGALSFAYLFLFTYWDRIGFVTRARPAEERGKE